MNDAEHGGGNRRSRAEHAREAGAGQNCNTQYTRAARRAVKHRRRVESAIRPPRPIRQPHGSDVHAATRRMQAGSRADRRRRTAIRTASSRLPQLTRAS